VIVARALFHDTRQEKIQAALEILGKRVVMAYEDAA
jgi:hypothetical protein